MHTYYEASDGMKASGQEYIHTYTAYSVSVRFLCICVYIHTYMHTYYEGSDGMQVFRGRIHT